MNAPVIDRQTIDMLREMDAVTTEDDLLIELIDDFLFHSADLVETMKHSLQAHRERELAAQSHSLKGASLNIGALALFQVCDAMETIARQCRLSGTDYWLMELEQAYGKTATALTELRSRTSRGETIDDLLG
ncbi:MAG: Hpt domain-containing protein [Caldilineaceae bacterium]|nr:Hpt domain-containing protein [Caldilineaceae bacterium]